MSLHLLGSAGGPLIDGVRTGPSSALVYRGRTYVVDSGLGATQQLAKAGLDLRSVDAMFVTHGHVDHTADLGNFILFSWANGRVDPISVFGPPLVADLIDHFLMSHAVDLEHRQALGRVPLRNLFDVRAMSAPGFIIEYGSMRVSAALANHWPMVPSFAFRFDTPEYSVTFSGDTGPSAAIMELASGSDILVHEAYSPAHMNLLWSNYSGDPKRGQAHFARSHTSAEEAGVVASEAGVDTLVLNHLIPASGVSDREWRLQAGKRFDGRILVAEDLMHL